MAANLGAQVAIAQENYRAAFRILQKALHRHPQAPSLLMNAGLIALRFRQLDQARAYFQQVLAKIADHPDALLHLAVVDALQKNYQAAEQKYQRLLASRKKNPAVFYNLSVLKSRTHNYQAAMHALQRYDDLRGKKVGCCRPNSSIYMNCKETTRTARDERCRYSTHCREHQGDRDR